MQRLATALRSLLRFWHLQGLIAGPLDHGALGRYRRPGLPRPLEPGQVAALLASCDRDTAARHRDLAIVTLLARMGLRGGEAAALRLDDIDRSRRTRAGSAGRTAARAARPGPGPAIPPCQHVSGDVRRGQPRERAAPATPAP